MFELVHRNDAIAWSRLPGICNFEEGKMFSDPKNYSNQHATPVSMNRYVYPKS